MEKTAVGFYRLLRTADKKGYLGAILVTDEIGKPEEFRVTYPVKPTSLQERLYGSSLLPHIGVELCGRPLVQSLVQKPLLLILEDQVLLSIADGIACPVVQIESAGELLQVNVNSNDRERDPQLRSLSGRFQPLTVRFPTDCPDDRKAEVRKTLEQLFAVMDLLEPLQRIEVAVNELSRLDEKFR